MVFGRCNRMSSWVVAWRGVEDYFGERESATTGPAELCDHKLNKGDRKAAQMPRLCKQLDDD